MTIIEPREMLNSAASTINFTSSARDLLSELLRLPGTRMRERERTAQEAEVYRCR